MKVLYVDDDALNRRVVQDMLSVVGLTMAEAESAEVGLSMIDQDAFNIVLMDLRMPGMDGFTAIERLRARSDDKGRLPVIVVTADTTSNIQDRCRLAGADDVLQKPVALQSWSKHSVEQLQRHRPAEFFCPDFFDRGIKD